jgi:hypothetical protein
MRDPYTAVNPIRTHGMTSAAVAQNDEIACCANTVERRSMPR